MSFFKRIKRMVTAEGGRRVGGNGRTGGRGGAAAGSDVIFSLSSAHVTMETRLGLVFTGRAAVCVKSVSGMQFEEAKDEVARFLDISKSDSGLRHRMVTDSYGYLWVVLDGEEMEDVLAAVMAIGDTLGERGFSAQMLASIFEFGSKIASEAGGEEEEEGNGIAVAATSQPYGERRSIEKSRRQYLIYNYRRNNFYPFVPLLAVKAGSGNNNNTKTRDTEQEMRIMAALTKEEEGVPFERDMALWYPLWDLPL